MEFQGGGKTKRSVAKGEKIRNCGGEKNAAVKKKSTKGKKKRKIGHGRTDLYRIRGKRGGGKNGGGPERSFLKAGGSVHNGEEKQSRPPTGKREKISCRKKKFAFIAEKELETCIELRKSKKKS